MLQVVNDFKAIMADKKERKEFLGCFACVLLMMAALYMAIVVLG